METYKVLAGEVSKEYGVSIDGSRTYAKQDSIELSPLQLLLIGVGILVLIIVDMTFLGGAITQSILWILASGRGGGSGRSDGGFGGFGGGSSGGGGASRRW